MRARWALAGLLLAAPLLGAEGALPPIRFEAATAAVGAGFRHHTRTFPGEFSEVLGMFTVGGSSVAVADYDGDGDLDLFLCDSELGTESRLLRNDLEAGRPEMLRFTDVTREAGLGGGNDAHSIVSDAMFFDADDDGREDLLVARFGTPILYRNLGGGKFEDVSAGAGLSKFGNTIAVIAFDADNDGRLDLLFANYFKPVNLLDLPDHHVLPNDLDAATNGGGVTFWKNVTEQAAPDGKPRPIRFVEATEAVGLAKLTGWSLDLGHADLNNDGWQDLYVACDYGTDRLFFNQRDGTFRDATQAAIGFDTKKGMNVDFADYNHDGWLDVYVTNITDEYMKECNMLWSNNGDGTFIDLAKETGTCDTLWGWGAKFGDFDNDTWEDLFVVNGLRSAGPENYIPTLVEMIIKPGIDFSDVASWPKIGAMSWSGRQKKKLFHNLSGQLFKEIAAEAGVDNVADGRGIGVADFDGDGKLDLYQANANQDSLFYRNRTENAGHYVELDLRGIRSNRDGIGARVTLKVAGATLIREVNGGNGYASQSGHRLHFGLGSSTAIESAVVSWPSGQKDTLILPLDRRSMIEEGKGVVPR
ncbi:MAG: CRTAC1 family protein [Acidobacteriota bacterium]